MKRLVVQTDGDSCLVGELPRGCQLCARGTKLVLFVTGLCDSSCFYCPLSQEKTGKDVVFADELRVNNSDDVLLEVDAIGGEGAGISGGDPMCALPRTLDYISLLKSKYGSDFHIHLYTSRADTNENILQQLIDAGLDEIRFHPQSSDWSGIEAAIRLGMNVGLEVPAFPDKQKVLIATLQRAEEVGVAFVNINELEASETNFSRLTALGMRLTSMGSASIEGSRETAMEAVDWAAANLVSLTVHFCSARFKDSIQMRNRLERRLERTIRPFEERDETDPLIILGLIRAFHGSTLSIEQLNLILEILMTYFDVPGEMMNLDDKRYRIEIAPWILEEITNDLRSVIDFSSNLEIGIAYEYPSSDRLQTLFEPL